MDEEDLRAEIRANIVEQLVCTLFADWLRKTSADPAEENRRIFERIAHSPKINPDRDWFTQDMLVSITADACEELRRSVEQSL